MRHGTLQLVVLALFLLAFVGRGVSRGVSRGLCVPVGHMGLLLSGLGLGGVEMDDDGLWVRRGRGIQVGKCWWDRVDEFLDIVGGEETGAAVYSTRPPVRVRLGYNLDDVVFVERQVFWFLSGVGRPSESVDRGSGSMDEHEGDCKGEWRSRGER